MGTMTENQIAQLGIEAARVLDNPAFKQAMTTLKSSVIAQWIDCPVRDKEGQLLLLQLAKLSDKFNGILVGMLENGKFTQSKIDLDKMRDESKAKRIFRQVTG